MPRRCQQTRQRRARTWTRLEPRWHAASRTQGHSILITSCASEGEDAVEVNRVAPEGTADVPDLVVAQDVEGEAPQGGEDVRAFPDAAGVLVHGDIERAVHAVLNAPMATCGRCIVFRAQTVLG